MHKTIQGTINILNMASAYSDEEHTISCLDYVANTLELYKKTNQPNKELAERANRQADELRREAEIHRGRNKGLVNVIAALKKESEHRIKNVFEENRELNDINRSLSSMNDLLSTEGIKASNKMTEMQKLIAKNAKTIKELRVKIKVSECN